MKQFRPALAVLACGLLLAACGESADDEKATGGVSLAAAKGVVIDYLGKGFEGDAAACKHESEKFASAQNTVNGTADCADRIEAIKVMLTDGEPLADIEKVDVTVSEDGDGALAEVSGEGVETTFRLVVADGAWLLDEEIDTDGEEVASLPEGAREVPEAEAIELAEKFCAVQVGTTRAAVERILGEPSNEGTDADGQAEVEWLVNRDSYTVWFADDAVASYSSATPREDAACQ